MAFTDQKINRYTRNRKPYYSPTDNGMRCPFLLVDAQDEPIVEGDTYVLGKCVCTEQDAYCSYALPNDKTDSGSNVCRRYMPWYQKSKTVVDTHQRVLKIQDGELNWFT